MTTTENRTQIDDTTALVETADGQMTIELTVNNRYKGRHVQSYPLNQKAANIYRAFRDDNLFLRFPNTGAEGEDYADFLSALTNYNAGPELKNRARMTHADYLVLVFCNQGTANNLSTFYASLLGITAETIAAWHSRVS